MKFVKEVRLNPQSLAVRTRTTWDIRFSNLPLTDKATRYLTIIRGYRLVGRVQLSDTRPHYSSPLYDTTTVISLTRIVLSNHSTSLITTVNYIQCNLLLVKLYVTACFWLKTQTQENQTKN